MKTESDIFSGAGFSSKDDGDKRRMAATPAGGTAPKPVQVNAEASVGRSNSGNVKYDAAIFDIILHNCVRCGHAKAEHRGRSGGCSRKDGFGNECECARYMAR